jgi:CHAT domain-containing protein
MPRKISIRLSGRPAPQPSLPPLFAPASRTAGGAQGDEFLPPGYLKPVASVDIGVAARSTGSATAEVLSPEPQELVLLELEDGSTLVTSAARLQEAVERSHPDWLEGGAIPFEKLRTAGAEPGRGFAEAVGGLITKVFTFTAADDDEIIRDALRESGLQLAELGVTWAGTKALMWAVESRLVKAPGLYRWFGGRDGTEAFVKPDAADLEQATAAGLPMLVFVHGTASSSRGSFGDLQAGDRDVWAALEQHFKGGIFALEHRTLSESPIENALQLAQALPRGAQLHLVSHSRGGLVADLLCLSDIPASLIAAFGRPRNMPGTGDLDPDSDEAKVLASELDDAHAGHRKQLAELAALLHDKQFDVRRYVRCASPANGTKLASGNFDLFLSGLLSLIGQVPWFVGNPFYAAFKRVVIEIAKKRTDPHLVPGIEAMLPDSPMARLLNDAPPRNGLSMAVIAGDIEGGHLLKRLGVLLTDTLIFEREDNDLVVDTSAMLAGIAPRAQSRVLFDRGADVSHFRYFANVGTRTALRDWLTVDAPAALDSFRPLPGPGEFAAALAAAARDVQAADRPVVVVLPGVMGSHLQVDRHDRVWFDPLDIAAGGLDKIAWDRPRVEADDLFGLSYGALCDKLADSHRVVRFPYDWRQPLDVLGDRLGELLDQLLGQTQQPIRLLAHSMGGLVVRACIHKRRGVMDALMTRDGARLVMLGTPNQGAHSMVENLLGKGDTLRMLVRLDLKHTMQQVLDIVAGFRGALQLLPKRGFRDMFQGQSDGGGLYDYQDARTWTEFAPLVKDFWFGNGQVGRPSQAVLDSASWLWTQDGPQRPALPPDYARSAIYVFGIARNTPCGVRVEGGRLKMVGTAHGDGTVSWESGRIDGIGRYYYMPAAHGDLASTRPHFAALVDLLQSGSTSALETTAPAVRALAAAQPVSYDAGPPALADAAAAQRVLLGASLRQQLPVQLKRRLEVGVQARDLRFIDKPILVGHYEQDPIAGPQRLIDRELLEGDLSERHSLGLYAGPRGTATVVVRPQNDAERQRGSLYGAVVTGLGPYDGALTASHLTEAVRAGALRYLLHIVDVIGKDAREVPLAALLLGYNSSANLSIPASIEALVRGVTEANARFFESTRLDIRIGRLDIVEIYLDTAITAVHALREMAPQLAAQARLQHTELVCRDTLEQGEGVRQRLFDAQNQNYWPRLVVTGVKPESDAPAGGERPVTGLADSLRFLFIGQRARAESIVQQRQPGLVESLVRQQIASTVWQQDFGRMLFQLMVPHEFKDAARQLDRMVLVVDGATANLPWELMLADDPARNDDGDQPMAIRTAVVRQLATATFRRQVRQSVERSALVIGNPSVEGFAKVYAPTNAAVLEDPPDLSGAREEAEAVARLLQGLGYGVTALTAGDSAANVIAALYRQAWRILHVSAHGVFELPHPDGRARSGVLLSDGLLITAAEIAAMEVVPEVVFLNCCHLGTIEIGRAGNKLASSIARELIEIGVRCVVVAGWAVNDKLAALFGRTFYEQLLLKRQPFGMAVKNARIAVWKERAQDITWGAFQAWGDPAWLAEPRAAVGAPNRDEAGFVSPEEFLDELARLRAEQSRRGRTSESDRRGQMARLEQLVKRCRPAWLDLPEVQSLIGFAWYDLNRFDKARQALLQALRSQDRHGRVPLTVIEKLVNAEARLGEQTGDATLISGAIQRLDGLDLAGLGGAGTAERWALRGSAYKRLAAVAARTLLQAEAMPGALDAAAVAQVRQLMQQALGHAAQAYAEAEGGRTGRPLDPYLALNRLALEALLHEPGTKAAAENVVLARACGLAADASFARQPGFWDAIMSAEAKLTEALLDGRLHVEAKAGDDALDDLLLTYRHTLRGVSVKPAELDSVLVQLELLAQLLDALAGGRNDGRRLAAARLRRLAQRLRPERDLPPATPASSPPPAGRRARPAAAPAGSESPATPPTPKPSAAAKPARAPRQRAPRKKAAGR